MVAILTRLFGFHNLELAEDIFQDTLHQALNGLELGPIPDNPSGWLMVVAKRKAINAVRRERLHRSFARDMDALLKSEWTAAYTMDHVFLEDEIKDSQLRMIFTCCHPALPMEGQLALTLKTLCGFNIAEIAAAMLTTESNINKRLYRVKEKIRNEEIPFTVPAGHQLLPRLDAVLLVIYLLFNEGYNSSGDNAVIRQDLCLEAMRLAMVAYRETGNQWLSSRLCPAGVAVFPFGAFGRPDRYQQQPDRTGRAGPAAVEPRADRSGAPIPGPKHGR